MTMPEIAAEAMPATAAPIRTLPIARARSPSGYIAAMSVVYAAMLAMVTIQKARVVSASTSGVVATSIPAMKTSRESVVVPATTWAGRSPESR